MSNQKSIFGTAPKQSQYVIPGSGQQSPFKYKKKFVLCGTVGCGKSSVIASLYLTAMTLSADEPEFLCNVDEGLSNVLDDVSRLRRGHYPSKTDVQTNPIQSGLVLTWKQKVGPFEVGEKNIQIPTVDVPGEVYNYMIQREKTSTDVKQVMVDQTYISQLEQSDALILVLAASRVFMFKDDFRLEDVPRGVMDVNLSEDDDVNAARILNTFQFRKQQQHKNIDALGIIIHKWDLLKPYAEKLGMDLYDPSGEGFEKFMRDCYPTTNMAIKKLASQNKVRIFPSHLEALRDEKGNVVTWSDGSPRVATMKDINPNTTERTPLYSEQSYIDFFEWIRSFAA